jgi:hypothetical protein
LKTQRIALDRLYHPLVLGRLLNNRARLEGDAESYGMLDMFTQVRRAIWGEIVGPGNVNSFRRQLQMAHLEKIISIYLSNPGKYPDDARTLAARDLSVLHEAARTAASSSTINDMSRAHFAEVARRIESARNARMDFASSEKKK